MPVGRGRNDFPGVKINGRIYRLGGPPSEQDDVLVFTRKLVNMTPEAAAQAVITEEQLEFFSRVYTRLRQVPRRNRERLEAWRDAHPQEVRDWQLGGFFNYEVDEPRFKPRKPGLPPGRWEPIDAPPAAAQVAAPPAVVAAPAAPAAPLPPPVGLAPGVGAPAALAGVAAPVVPPAVVAPPAPPVAAAPPLPPQPPAIPGLQDLVTFFAGAVNQQVQQLQRANNRAPAPANAMIVDANPQPQAVAPPAQNQNPQGPIPELMAILDSIRAEVGRLTCMANRAHRDDPYRGPLSDVAQRVSHALEQADRRVTALGRRKRRRRDRHRQSASSSSSSDDDEAARRERLHARRAQILASIDNDTDADNNAGGDSGSGSDRDHALAPARDRAADPEARGSRPSARRQRRQNRDAAAADSDRELSAPEPARAARRRGNRRAEPQVKVEKKEEEEEAKGGILSEHDRDSREV